MYMHRIALKFESVLSHLSAFCHFFFILLVRHCLLFEYDLGTCCILVLTCLLYLYAIILYSVCTHVQSVRTFM